MKRALVLSLVVVLGLGVGAFAQLTGSWESTLSFNLGATTFADYIVDLTSTFEIDYSLSGWTFGSASEFDLTGFSAQSFSVEGALGAFAFESSVAFAPQAVLVWVYPDLVLTLTSTQTASAILCSWWIPVGLTEPMFLTLDATATVNIAGVTASAYVFMDQSNFIVQNDGYAFLLDGNTQTDSYDLPSYPNGVGSKITLSGSIGGIDVTSYTYFNLTESDKLTTYCPAIGKRGVFHIASDGCGVAFTEEYLMFEGLTFGCVEFGAAVKFTCDGFSIFKLLVSGIDIGGWASLNVGINFGVDNKALDLCLTMNKLAFSCITVEIGFGLDTGYIMGTETGPLSISDISIHGFSFTTEVGAVTFTASSELDKYSKLFSSATAWKYLNGDDENTYLVPWAGISGIVPGSAGDPCVPSPGSGDTYTYVQSDASYFSVLCIPEYRYRLWEMFQISIDEDACCGGLFGVDIVTYFGDLQELSYAGYAVFEQGDTAWAISYLLGLAGITAPAVPTDFCYDQVVTFAEYTEVGATELFNWAYTTVEFSVGMGSNLTLNLGAGISAFGWESLDLGFEFTW